MTIIESTCVPMAKRPRRRSAESQARLREEMIAHAKEIFLDKGYEAVSVRAVTQACGISTMSFYSYFESKQDLARHILVDFFDALYDGLVAAGEGKGSPDDVLRAHVETCLDHSERTPDCYRMAFAPQLETPSEPSLRFDDMPAYRRLVQLGRERLLASARAGGRVVTERAGALLHDLMLAKTLGFLYLAIIANRRASADHAELRGALVRDIVEMTRHVTFA
jgi:AcrR family transcriptional regulator